jgi:ribosomal protein S5
MELGNQEIYNKGLLRDIEKVDGLDEFAHLDPEYLIGEMYDTTEFNLIFLDADAICNVTRLNRIMRRRCLIYLGNKDGLISYGMGRGYTYQDAYVNCFRELKKNMIQIQIDALNTCPGRLIGRYHDYAIKIFSRREPNIWGSPLFTLMLRYAV